MIKSKKILALVCAVAMTAGLMACGSKETGNTDTAQTTESAAAETKTEETKTEETKEAEGAAISGTVSMAGSTSMEKLANAVAESFMAKYPDVTVTAVRKTCLLFQIKYPSNSRNIQKMNTVMMTKNAVSF